MNKIIPISLLMLLLLSFKRGKKTSNVIFETLIDPNKVPDTAGTNWGYGFPKKSTTLNYKNYYNSLRKQYPTYLAYVKAMNDQLVYVDKDTGDVYVDGELQSNIKNLWQYI